jgi:hypothetical protein
MNELPLKNVTRTLEATRRQLLDTGTRNRLVHVNRTNTRANCLNIVNERADEVYSILRLLGKRMRFKALGTDKQPSEDELLLAVHETSPEYDTGRQTDSFLDAPLGPEALAKRLLRLVTDARTAEEEQGVNILYLAIGFLRWRESGSSQIQRESPLVLLPVKLVRNERTSAYDIEGREEDLATNLPLQERLRQDFGITLPEVDEQEGWTPSKYFGLVGEKTGGQEGWSIDADGMQLGFFSFAKLLMHRDLDPASWPEGIFSENGLLRGLLCDGFAEESFAELDEVNLDEALDPADIIQVIDADTSQTRVIEAVRRGGSLVVQGPPGTGKSQTITNLIAAAAYDGKKVLFVAEKMAALSVVHDRLVRAGLRDICLELHSRTANKRVLAHELHRTLAASTQALPVAPDPSELRNTRNELNRVTKLLHEKLPPSGDTPFRAISEIVGFMGRGVPAPRVPREGLERLAQEDRRRARSAIENFVGALDRVGDLRTHPFRGARAMDLQPPDISRLGEELAHAQAVLESLCVEVRAVTEAMGQPEPLTVRGIENVLHWLEKVGPFPSVAAALLPLLLEEAGQHEFRLALQVGLAWKSSQEEAAETFVSSAVDADAEGLEAGIGLGHATGLSDFQLANCVRAGELEAIAHELKLLEEDANAAARLAGQEAPSSLQQAGRLLATFEWAAEAPRRAEELAGVLFEFASKGRLIEALASGEAWAEARAAARSRFLDLAWSADATAIRSAVARGQGSFLSRLFGGYRRASAELATLLSGPLPETPEGRLELATELARVATLRQRLAEDEGWLKDTLGPEWRGEQTAFSEVLAAARWLADSRNGGKFPTAAALLSVVGAVKGQGDWAHRLALRIQSCRQRWRSMFGAARGEENNEALLAALEARPFVEVYSFLARIVAYRDASSQFAGLLRHPMPPSVGARLGLVRRLVELRAQRRKLHAHGPILLSVLRGKWSVEETPFGEIVAVLAWMDRVRAALPFLSPISLRRVADGFPEPLTQRTKLNDLRASCLRALVPPFARMQFDLAGAGLPGQPENVPLPVLRGLLAEMNGGLALYNDWVGLHRARRAVVEAGAGDVARLVESGELAADGACAEFAYACAEARWAAACATRPELLQLAYMDRHELVNLFRTLELERIEATRNLILERHYLQIPRGNSGEMAVIRGEIARKKGHKPIRWLMSNAASMIQRIKPVMLMSPISVAQFLPPGNFTFDLLVIDEASQIRPADALGAIARARQIVVVGDQKQLPPTSFFDRLLDDVENNEDDEAEQVLAAGASEMESILSLCEARGLRQRMLQWHYRSRDPSLIRVSNAEFYGDDLILPPSPLQHDPDYGLKLRKVPGVYARGISTIGRKGTNRIEAEEIVQAVARHAREWPDLSLGVVAFSKEQASMVTEVLEIQRRTDSVLDSFLREGKSEDVFVKNIENVQGDERDVVLITVGYGPQEPNGRLMSMTFGPVNNEGGERRLNVLFSRARVRCEVFVSFEPGDIELSRVKRDGPRVLKRFLDYAKTGIMEGIEVTGQGADSPFEECVAAAIRSLGYEADPQVGTAGFRIDIGVRHPERPGQYLMAVECDGAAYHGSQWARERDRQRQGILEGLGWTFHRIWSTDWFHHRTREIDRLRKALEAARIARLTGVRVQGANSTTRRPDSAPTPVQPILVDLPQVGLRVPPYKRAEVSIETEVEPHDAPTAELSALVLQIVQIEGPIHIEEVARRIGSSFGRQRAGSRISDATRRAVRHALAQDPALQKDGEFLLTAVQALATPVRNRSEETGTLAKATYLPPMEIRAAAALIRKESGLTVGDDLVREVARLLGFQRVGSELASAISDALKR